MLAWAEGTGRPASGTLVKVETVGGRTSFQAVL
jgi:hypothetical protein